MDSASSGYAFGPVPSRRLGKSLGVNTIPAKHCTYSCVYCQVGNIARPEVNRQTFYDPMDIFWEVDRRLTLLSQKGESVDYLSIVPDGEPTLDGSLGKLICLLRSLGLPVAVISNSSLLGREEVRAELNQADWVSLKIDALDEPTWRRINRPHPTLRLDAVLEGIRTFRTTFTGTLVTETMLVAGINDSKRCMLQISAFLQDLRPQRAYLGIPTRPPAESTVNGPDEETFTLMHHYLAAGFGPIETLTGSEGDEFGITDNVDLDLLGILAVHPMREEAIRSMLNRAGATWGVIERLLHSGDLVQIMHNGQTFFQRRHVDRGDTTP